MPVTQRMFNAKNISDMKSATANFFALDSGVSHPKLELPTPVNSSYLPSVNSVSRSSAVNSVLPGSLEVATAAGENSLRAEQEPSATSSSSYEVCFVNINNT